MCPILALVCSVSINRTLYLYTTEPDYSLCQASWQLYSGSPSASVSVCWIAESGVIDVALLWKMVFVVKYFAFFPLVNLSCSFFLSYVSWTFHTTFLEERDTYVTLHKIILVFQVVQYDVFTFNIPSKTRNFLRI
jgi:hypothetical protein